MSLWEYNLISVIINITCHIRLRNDKYEFIYTVTTGDLKTIVLETDDRIIFSDEGEVIDVLNKGKNSIRKVEDFN